MNPYDYEPYLCPPLPGEIKGPVPAGTVSYLRCPTCNGYGEILSTKLWVVLCPRCADGRLLIQKGFEQEAEAALAARRKARREAKETEWKYMSELKPAPSPPWLKRAVENWQAGLASLGLGPKPEEKPCQISLKKATK